MKESVGSMKNLSTWPITTGMERKKRKERNSKINLKY